MNDFIFGEVESVMNLELNKKQFRRLLDLDRKSVV